MDAHGRMIFTRFHRVSMCFPETENGPCPAAGVIKGTWHIDGDNVVYNLDYSRFDSEKLKQRKNEGFPLRWFRDGAAREDESNFHRVK